jgi:hypothetical protein
MHLNLARYRKVKEFMTSEYSVGVKTGDAVHFAISRGNTHALEVLLQSGIEVSDYVYAPPLTEVEFVEKWNGQQTEKAAAAQAKEDAKKKK